MSPANSDSNEHDEPGSETEPSERTDFGLSRRNLMQAMGASAVGAGLLGTDLAAETASATNPPGNIGMNLDDPRGSELAFTDAAESLQDYRGVGDSDPTFDSSGWPTSDVVVVFFDNRPVAEFLGAIDDPKEYEIDVSGTYDLAFSGQADLTVNEGDATITNKSYDSGTNTTTADVILPEEAQLLSIEFTNTKRSSGSATGSGFTDLRLMRPGYSLDENEPRFTEEPVYLNRPFGPLRFMSGWLKTNEISPFDADGPVTTEWSQRIKPSDGSFFASGKYDSGTPWEYVAEFGNYVGSDIWINIPVSATDDYIRQVARLMQNELDSDLRIYVEYSNELWNFGFGQYAWNKEKAKEEVNSGNSNLNYDGEDRAKYWRARRVAQRSVEISRIFGDVFGSGAINDRVRVVVPWEAGAFPPDTFDPDKFQYVKDNYGAPSEFFWGYCVAGYFAYKPVESDDSVDTILDKMESNLPNYTTYAGIADDWNLELATYEAGPNTSKGGNAGTTNVENRIRAARTERMADLIKRNVRNFFEVGGDLFEAFTDAGRYGRYGTWGSTDDVTKPFRNYKYDAYLELNNSEYRDGMHAQADFESIPDALDGENNGFGWKAPWDVQGDDTGMPGYEIRKASPLTYQGLESSFRYGVGGHEYKTAGRRLDVAPEKQFAPYIDDNGLIGKNGTTIWASALLRKEEDSNEPAYLVPHKNAIVTYANERGETKPQARVGYFGSASNSDGTRYWGLKVDDSVTTTDAPVTVGETTLLVWKYEFGSTSTVSLYVDPATWRLGGGNPPSPDAQVSTTTDLAFQSLAYYGGNGPNNSAVDAVRFGDSFGAVTPEGRSFLLQAEDAAVRNGVSTNRDFIGYTDGDDYLKFENVDFGEGGLDTLGVHLAVPSSWAGSDIEIHLDRKDGWTPATLTTSGTGGWTEFETQTTGFVGGVSGVHDVFVTFSNSPTANVSWFDFR